MEIVFIYGPAAAGKLTVGRELARLTGLPLFHNHLVVDAVGAVFPFGSEPFVRLRERFWLEVFIEAARSDRSLIFTFAPEPSVALDFPDRVRAVVEDAGGTIVFVRLTLSAAEQERRIGNGSRAEFRKLRSVEVLRKFRAKFTASEAAMPAPDLTIDSERTQPRDAARRIAERAGLSVA